MTECSALYSTNHLEVTPMSDLYQLIDEVIEQIKTDIKRGDVSALESILIQHMPQDALEGYLEEE